MAVAHSTYRRYYPSLKSARCDEPYESRAEGYAKVKDEEFGDDEEDDGVLGGEGVPLRETRRDQSWGGI